MLPVSEWFGMTELSAGQMSDGELLARTAAGDGEAFGVFYDRFERELLAFLVRATGRAELAADLCAEVSHPGVTKNVPFPAWVVSATGLVIFTGVGAPRSREPSAPTSPSTTCRSTPGSHSSRPAEVALQRFPASSGLRTA